VANGDSIAVNGVCLTVTRSMDGDSFTADVMGETLIRSSLGALAPGSGGQPGAFGPPRRPPGRPPRAGPRRRDRHDHLPHAGRALGPGANQLPGKISHYVVEKGSIAVDGISLTVSALSPAGEPDAWFEVGLIPETLKRTTLGTKEPGDTVNLEVDVIAKYVEKLLSRARVQVSKQLDDVDRAIKDIAEPRAGRSSSWTTRTGRTRATSSSRPAWPPPNCSPSPSGTPAA
jgi:riboflavin synthase